MPVRTGVPRTTHKWLKPLYDALDASVGFIVPSGASGIANAAWFGRGVPIAQIGNSTGIVGFFGVTGAPQYSGYGGGFAASGGTQLWSGSSGILATGVGGSGLMQAISQIGWNGGTGTVMGINEIVRILKNVGLAPA